MPLIQVGICAGMTPSIVHALSSANIRNLTDFIAADLENLALVTEISYKELLALQQVVLAEYSAFPTSAADLYGRVVRSAAILSTGSPRLDQWLDGGLYTGEMTELVGHSAVGKTQFCHSTTVAVAKQTKLNVLYIDTSASFSVDRLLAILEPDDEPEADSILRRIKCCKVFSIFQMFDVLEETRQHLINQTDSFYCGLRLIVCDSVSGLVSPLLGGPQSQGHCAMVHFAQKLKILAHEYFLSVLVTNSLVGGDHAVPTASLGGTWQFVPHNRILLQRENSSSYESRENIRHATILKSCRQATGPQVSFTIIDKGLL